MRGGWGGVLIVRTTDLSQLAHTSSISRVVRLSGQVGAGKDVVEQTKDCLRKIDELLAMCGTEKVKMLSATVWLKNISADFAAFNEVRSSEVTLSCARGGAWRRE